MYQAIADAAALRLVSIYGYHRSGGTFAPLHKAGTVPCVARDLKKLGRPLPKEKIAWAYDLLGEASGGAEISPTRWAN